MELILASNSPRRKEILESGGYKFTITCSDFDEKSLEIDPKELAQTFAFGKAKSVYEKLKNRKDALVLGADTVVYINDTILGKPKDELDAKNMLKTLSGKTHCVVTGYCLISSDNIEIGNAVTFVTFNQLSDLLIEEYIKSGLYKGKAGSYGIQDGFPLVEKYDGSYTNVVGLPKENVFPLIDKMLK